MTCPSCGYENAEGAKFCSECGTPLTAPEPTREERKVVTVLFADLVGFTARSESLDPEEVRALQAPYWARVRSDLERYGGTVEKFIGDAVMALFGAPVAHEDDPERAVRAALAIRDWAREQDDLQVRIGITTGEALVSRGASVERGEGMASGDVVNTASRLQGAAPENGILVDRTTYRATEPAIHYGDAEPVEAKGKSEPVAVWEAVEARARFGIDTVQAGAPLVGRRREVDQLADALARSREERSLQLVTLVGVPGIGKSRLVYELGQIVEREPELITWRQGRSLPFGDGITYWALGEMVKAQAGILETDTRDEAELKLREAVSSLLPDESEAQLVETRLRPLVGVEAEADLGGDRRAESFSAWRRFLEALAEQRPTVLIFEDLHWADDNLLDFVDHFVDWAAEVPLLCLCTARPELLERRPAWGGGKLNASTLSLSPLSDEETARLIGELLERHVLPAEQQEALLARAGGNPLYAEQFARMLAERGEGEDLALPETVQGIIAARLDGLRDDEKALLQDAAVVGKVFWAGALAEMDGGERAVLEESLHGLERKEFIRRERRPSVEGESEYAFRHLLVRDVAYGQIPRGVRSQKHRLIAEWIASRGRTEDHAEMLAHHYLQALAYAQAAGEPLGEIQERARIVLREAGDRALALSAFPEAARFFEQALELWPGDDPERPALLLHYGRSRPNDVEMDDELLDEASRGLLEQGDREGAAEALILRGFIWWGRGRRGRVSQYVDRALELVQEEESSRAKAFVLSSAARFAMLAGDDETVLRIAPEALRMADQLGLEELRANNLNTLGIVKSRQGDASGLDDLRQAIEIAGSVKSPEQYRAAVNLAWEMATLGHVRRAWELHLESTEIATRLGLAAYIRWERGERVIHSYWRGDWKVALDGADEFITETEAGESHYMESSCRLIRSSVRLALGQTEGALADAERSVELARLAKDPQQLEPSLGAAAYAFMASGRTREAGELLDELVTSWQTSRAAKLSEAVEGAWVARELGRHDELRKLFAGMDVPNPWRDAGTAVLEGDFVRAADLLEEIGSVPDEAYARLRAAEELIRAGRRAEGDVQLQRALEFYRSVGAKRFVREGEQLLAETA